MFAYLKSKPSSLRQIELVATTNTPIDTLGEIHWVKLSDRQLNSVELLKSLPRKISMLAIAMIVALAVFIMLRPEALTLLLPFIVAIFMLVSISIPLVFFQRIFFGQDYEKMTQRIGWDGEHIHLSFWGRKTVLEPRNVYYTNNVVYGDRVIVRVQQLSQMSFDKKSFESIICPVLDAENKLSTFKMMGHQLKAQGLGVIVARLIVALTTLGLYFFYGI